ncbi:MAG: DUF2470 domain-containing protein [Alphaproteobacteria bacterium]|nr:DUF2470 domain-containing protein [Alphaproteobacteria bacterium]
MQSTAPGAGPEARWVRDLMRAAATATLATRRKADGWPFASLVQVAADHDGSPLLLLSALAEHTRNLEAEPRVALLFDGTAGLAEPLTGPRLTVLGALEGSALPGHRARYLRRHPGAAAYADFGDFGFYRLVIAEGYLVAGFGRIHSFPAGLLQADTADCAALIAAEAEIITHMNADHGDAVGLYATALLGLPPGAWRMTGVDSEGIDLGLEGRLARFPFAEPVRTPEEARAALVRLVGAARAGG